MRNAVLKGIPKAFWKTLHDEALKAGANDYLLKDRLIRLGPAIDRALKEAAQKRKRQSAEEALRESHAVFNSFMDNSPAVAFMKDAEGRYVYVNKPFEKVFGQKLSFLKGRTSFDWLPPISAAVATRSRTMKRWTMVPLDPFRRSRDWTRAA